MQRSQVLMCTVKDEASATSLLSAMQAEGFVMDTVSVLHPTRAGETTLSHEAHTKAPEGASIGAGTGGLAGGLFGLLVGLGTLTVPGFGPLLAAGPLVAALSGMGAGGAIGGLSGWLVGIGLPEVEARLYQTRLTDGGTLVAVDCGQDYALLTRARELFDAHGGEDVSLLRPNLPREERKIA
jgi:hypothetical protein